MTEIEISDWRHPPVAGRPPLDAVVYKLRFVHEGKSHTSHYSDPKAAERWAQKHRAAGTLLFYGRYTLEERIT